ncbi:MAG: hypothetical protein ACLR9W_09995 [Enterobacter hormaechei]
MPDGSGYSHDARTGAHAAVRRCRNHRALDECVVEKCIMLAPEQYMWLHRRFKTRPQGVPSRYESACGLPGPKLF